MATYIDVGLDSLYPVGHSSLQCSWYQSLKLARFQVIRTRANKRLFKYVSKATIGVFGQNNYRFGRFLAFRERDISLPLNPGVGLSTAKLIHFFELTKEMPKKIIFYTTKGHFFGNCTKKSPIAFENTKGDFVRILRKRTLSVLAVSRSSLGVLSVVARWNLAPYGETIREGILIIDTFC